MTKNDHQGLFFLGLFVAAGIALGGYFVGQTMYNAKVALNTAEAKGLAERRVVADRANWTVGFSVEGADRAEIPALYRKAEQHRQAIVDVLQAEGFNDDEIELGVLDYSYREFRDEQQKLVDQKHMLVGTINVETDRVELVAQARANVNKLIAEGVEVRNNPPAYRFTKLNEIKPDMLREATTNARLAATEFADNAGVSVGGIRSARQGTFQVRDVGEDYGYTSKIEKDVRVVTTITFYLTD